MIFQILSVAERHEMEVLSVYERNNGQIRDFAVVH